MAEARGTPQDRIASVVAELRSRGLVTGEQGAPRETRKGRALIDPVVAARRDELDALLASHGARPPEVEDLLRRLARELVGERP